MIIIKSGKIKKMKIQKMNNKEKMIKIKCLVKKMREK